MFDKLLCKHIKKKTIHSYDIIIFLIPHCMFGAFVLITSMLIGATCYEAFGYTTVPVTINNMLNYTGVGFIVLLVTFTVLKIEVAHCPVKDENGGIEK